MSPKFVGDLSAQDAALLEQYAVRARSVLEFGVGGSTQIIAQSMQREGTFVSVDTNQGWIDRTKTTLHRLGVSDKCRMCLFDGWKKTVGGGPFDMIFVDGLSSLRLQFAIDSWPLLATGGHMLFHDTRHPVHIAEVGTVLGKFGNEIESLQVNQGANGASSNITAIKKKILEPYVNWNIAEGRAPWKSGQGPVPEEFYGQR